MRDLKTFIPRDKPKSWVIQMLAGFLGLLSGLTGFAAAWASIAWLSSVATFVFVLCWLVFAATWLVSIHGLLTGRYRNIKPKAWKDQQW